MRTTIRMCVAGVAAAALGACSLDLENPNAPTETQVITTVDGVIALATGLQARYAASYGNFAYMAGLVTDEFASKSASLISISDAEQGVVPPGTAIAENVFNSIYRTVYSADDLLAGAEALRDGLEPGTYSGLRVLAFALKADALGQALQSYQQIPIDIYKITEPEYVPRSAALTRVRDLLDSAFTQLQAQTPSAFFNNSILTPGVNLANVVHLFRARYARMAGDNAGAIAASNLVARSGPAAMSVLTYPAPGTNFYAAVTGGVNGIAPRRQWRLSMTGGDQRFAYFVTPSTTLTGRVNALLDDWARYGNPNAPLPVYFPDEALLIKAEALANQNTPASLTESQAVLDSMRTDCAGGRGLDDPKACLAPLAGALTQQQLLDEIYLQRKYELLATGLRWEDSRRRNAIQGPVAAPAVPVDAQRCWLPYAVADRNANPHVPPDPAEPTTFPSGCPTT